MSPALHTSGNPSASQLGDVYSAEPLREGAPRNPPGGHVQACLKPWPPGSAKAMCCISLTLPQAPDSPLTCAAKCAGRRDRSSPGNTCQGVVQVSLLLPRPRWHGSACRMGSTPIRDTKETTYSFLGCRCRKGKRPREKTRPPLCPTFFLRLRDRFLQVDGHG